MIPWQKRNIFRFFLYTKQLDMGLLPEWKEIWSTNFLARWIWILPLGLDLIGLIWNILQISRLLIFFVDQAGGLGQSVQAQQQQQQQNYLNFGGHFIQPQQPPQPQALINPASYIGQMAAAAQQAQQAAGQPHQPQIPISSLVATAAAHAASKLPLLRTPTTLYSKVRLHLYIRLIANSLKYGSAPDLEKKWGQKCSNGQRFIFIEVISYKIHTLGWSKLQLNF